PDLILGREWLFFCRQTLPQASFDLSLGTVHTDGRHKVLFHELCSLFYVFSFSVVVSSCSAYPSLRKSPQEAREERAQQAADVVLKAAGNKSKTAF
ncbi:hypothetical protein B0H14DRAFT_3854967, partial [Mycena olivaceomarginata]